MYYAPCLVLVEHSLCHEPISVLINVFMLFGWCLLSTLLVLGPTIHDIRHWPPTTAMMPLRRMGALDCLHDSTTCIMHACMYVYMHVCMYVCM